MEHLKRIVPLLEFTSTFGGYTNIMAEVAKKGVLKIMVDTSPFIFNMSMQLGYWFSVP